MNYISISAAKPGSPVPKLEKRTNDVRTYWLDCKDLLALGEMVCGPTEAVSVDDIQISEVRTREGRYVQFRASGGPTDMPFIEYKLRFNVTTTAQNIISVPLILKVYSD